MFKLSACCVRERAFSLNLFEKGGRVKRKLCIEKKYMWKSIQKNKTEAIFTPKKFVSTHKQTHLCINKTKLKFGNVKAKNTKSRKPFFFPSLHHHQHNSFTYFNTTPHIRICHFFTNRYIVFKPGEKQKSHVCYYYCASRRCR